LKLNKWKCANCGFEWFEPTEFNNSDHNVDHGCPQGCDDAGKIIDMVEATDKKGKWISWILSKEDIDVVAGRIGIKKKDLSEERYDDIASKFINGFERANEDWAQTLEYAIDEVVK